MDVVVAIVLLTTSPDVPEPIPDPQAWSSLQASLTRLAIEWEILDPRETRYILARIEDYPADMETLRRRYQRLKDAPLVADATRFPSTEYCNACLEFNRAYHRYLSSWLDRDDPYQKAAIKETEAMYRFWDEVRDVSCEYYYVTKRRQSLKILLELMGPEDYYSGWLWPFVPHWRFCDG